MGRNDQCFMELANDAFARDLVAPELFELFGA
jgi:hypothetical protein